MYYGLRYLALRDMCDTRIALCSHLLNHAEITRIDN